MLFISVVFPQLSIKDKQIYDNKINKVTPKARQFYQREKIYVNPSKPKITPIFHQIWFGSKPPKFKRYLMNNVKKILIYPVKIKMKI